MAEEAELDLVEIVPNAEPPVCRVMDYGKYLFELNKKKHAAKKKQKQIQVKEIKFRPGTEDGDYQIKLRNLIKFLTSGDKVNAPKIVVAMGFTDAAEAIDAVANGWNSLRRGLPIEFPVAVSDMEEEVTELIEDDPAGDWD